MFEKDSPIVLQNINMIVRQLFLLFKKSTTFWDNPRIYVFGLQVFLVISKINVEFLNPLYIKTLVTERSKVK